MYVTELPIVKSVNEMQLSNAELEISVTELGITTLLRFLHELNPSVAIVFTVLGILMLENPHPVKAWLLIDVN